MSFTIDLEWPAPRQDADIDVASVRMSVHDAILTQVYDVAAGRMRDQFRASVTSLAFWFADNWWRLRYEPMGNPAMVSTDWRLRHELSSGSSNELWPPIMIYGVGPRVMIAPALGKRGEEGGLRYIEPRTHSVPALEYEEGLDDFFASVQQACARHADAPAFATLIGQLSVERGDPELAGWRRLEACLGYDPDLAPHAVVDALVALEDGLGGEAVEEAAIASPGPDAPRALTQALAAIEASDLEVDFAALGHLERFPDPHGLTPWQAAEDAALRLRDMLQLPDRLDGPALGDLLRTRWDDLKAASATARNLPYGAMRETDGDKARLALQMNPQIDRRFELARMIGDELWTRGRSFGVISRAKTDRQKYQRAFAQALLCPMVALQRIVNLNEPTVDQIGQAARYFDVRRNVIMTILINRGYLPHETAADWLEAA